MRTRLLPTLGLFTSFCAPLLLGGCSLHSDSPAAVEDAGAIGVALQLAPGIDLPSVTYTITRAGGFSKTGPLDLTNSSKLVARIGGLPPGAGYSISLTGNATGGFGCLGSATFAVMSNATTNVVVNLQCKGGSTAGTAQINGTTKLCPVIDELTAAPAEARIGGSVALIAGAHDGDSAALTYGWAASSGTFSNAAAASTSFTCATVGEVPVTVSVSDGTCTETLSTTVTCSPAAITTVFASVETDPIPGAGDSADDPAIWVNPTNPALSVVIGTDKTAGGGLAVYGLDGHQLQFAPAGALNNVDLRDGFSLGGQSVTLVTAGNRTNNSIAIFKLDPATRQLTNVAARTITTLATYGSCMYHSPVTGKLYYFVDSKDGEIEQWELFDNGAGLVDATKIRNLKKLGTQPEACVVDDELGFLYIGEEDVGIWKYGAEPTTDPASPLGQGISVDHVGPGGHLVADVEGLAIAKTGAGTGYLIVSNQGDSTYPMYTREGANTYVKTFRVGTNVCGIDEVTGSDGIEVTTASLGPAFPQGLFVTQDDTNPGFSQNFKLVPLQDILGGGSPAPTCAPPTEIDAGAPDAGIADAGAPPVEAGPAGNPAAFCATYCGKCSTCWNPAGGFSEGDCLYQLSKPSFSVDDCTAGCLLGRTPGFPISNLPANWETMACLDFDAAI
jgi:3-phytase